MIRFETDSFMDRNREAQRSAMAALNGVSGRRQRSCLMNDGLTEVKEGVKLRDRAEKRERDRDSLKRGKGRRSERFSKRNEVDEGEESSDYILVDEEIPLNTASFTQSHRKSFLSGRVSRQAAAPSLNVSNEMISVQVPRKARSACVKRYHDCRTSSGSGGFIEDFRRGPGSPASLSSEVGSPFSSKFPKKQRKKPNASKSRLPKSSRPPSPSRDQLEIEVAEVLSGLKKQCETSKEEDHAAKSFSSSELKDAIVNRDVDFSLSSKKMKMEDGDFLGPVEHSTNAPGINSQVEISSGKSEKICSMEPQDEAMKQEISKLSANEEHDRRYIVENKERDKPQMLVTKGIFDVSGMKNQSENINGDDNNSMAPPSMPSTSDRIASTLAPDSKPIEQDSETETFGKDGEISTKTAKAMLDREKVENQDLLKLDLKKHNQDDGRDTSIGLHSHGQSQQQAANPCATKPENLAKPSSEALQIGGWPTGLPPPEYMPPIGTHKPVDGFIGTSKVQKPRPKRCATHYHIARNIQLHQQFVKTNHLWPINPSSFSLTGGDVGPNNLYVIPPASAETLIPGSQSLQGSFPRLNLKSSAQDKARISANIPTQKANFSDTTQKRLHSSAADGNLHPSQAFLFPISHQQQPISAARNQTAPSKSGISVTKAGISAKKAVISASVSFNYSSSDTNGYTFQPSNLPGKSLPYFHKPSYSTHMFHPSEIQQQQLHGQREKSSTIGSTSSHKQLHTQVTAKNSFTSSLTVPKQHLLSSSHQPHKLETKFIGEKSVYGQTSTVPCQPLNFSMSFGPMKGSGTSSNLNFSSNGHQIVPAPHSCDSKIDDGKKGILRKPPAMPSGHTLIFDNSAKTLNFHWGNWPRAITASTTISNSPVSTALPNTSQRLEIQKHNLSKDQQHQPQQHSAGNKSMATNNGLPASSVAAKFPNNLSVYTQANQAASQPTQWKCPATSSSLTACSSFNLKQYQELNMVRTQGGQTQISFSGISNHGQPQTPNSSRSQPQPQATLAVGSPPHGKTHSVGSKRTGSSVMATQTQQTDNSATGSGQKSSSVCGRNVPSIISSCPSHLSEL